MRISFSDGSGGSSCVIKFSSNAFSDGRAAAGPGVEQYRWVKDFGEDKPSMFGFLDRLKALGLTAKNALEVTSIEPFDEKDVTVTNNNAFLSFVGNALEIDGCAVRFGLPLRGVESELTLDFSGSDHAIELGHLYKIDLQITDKKLAKRHATTLMEQF